MVIAIIGLLSSVVFASLNSARTKARDAARLAEIQEIVKALALYYSDYNAYPDSDFDGCGGWDNGNRTYPLLNGRGMDTYFGGKVPIDEGFTADCQGYNYYRYPAGYAGCDSARGAYFVLGVRDMETSPNPHPDSPGWSCPSRNWQGEFDYVLGGFER